MIFIPPEVYGKIFGYLRNREILKLRVVSKRWDDMIVHSDYVVFWERLYVRKNFENIDERIYKKIINLDCYYNQNITDLSKLINLKKLYCYNCDNINIEIIKKTNKDLIIYP